MNWDVTMGYLRQAYGRAAQWAGTRFERRDLVLAGEQAQYAGRLQARYGALKHQVQWGALVPSRPRAAIDRSLLDTPIHKN